METKYLNAKEAARYMQIGLTTFYGLVQLEGLQHVRLGKSQNAHIRTTHEWIDKWMESRAVELKF